MANICENVLFSADSFFLRRRSVARARISNHIGIGVLKGYARIVMACRFFFVSSYKKVTGVGRTWERALKASALNSTRGGTKVVRWFGGIFMKVVPFSPYVSVLIVALKSLKG